MTISQYLQNIYEADGERIFHNVPYYVASLFFAGGSHRFPPEEHKASSPGDYLYKIYANKRPLTQKIKKSTQPVSRQSLTIFFEKNFSEDYQIEKMMAKFKLGLSDEVNKSCFISALVTQFELIINSSENDVQNVVPETYMNQIEPNRVLFHPNFKVQTDTRGLCRYSLIIYEDDQQKLHELEEEFGNLNKDEKEKYYIDVFDKHVATDIISESTSKDIDAYIIDISRFSTISREGGYTDYSFSGKDLVDDLLEIRFRKSKVSNLPQSVFFIYSTMITDELRNMFSYNSSSLLNGLSNEQRKNVLNTVEFVYLNKSTYSSKAVARCVKTYFDQKYSSDYLNGIYYMDDSF